MSEAAHTNTTPASVDAELLALAAEFQTVDARLMAINDELMADTTGTMSMDKGEPAAVHARWWAIVNRVIEMPALTVPGWAAKAAIIPPVIRDVSSTCDGTPDINLALSLVRDLTGQAGTGPDADLLAACAAFHAAHREMKAGRGDTPEHEAATDRAVKAWYAALATVKAIPARTAAGQQAKAGVVYTALNDVLPLEQEDSNREEFAALTFLAELLGLDPETLPPVDAPVDAPAAPTDAPAAQDDIDALLAASAVADDALFDMETGFYDLHNDIAMIGHMATSERQIPAAVWRRLEDHMELGLETLEGTWTLAQERRHALRGALKAEQAARKALERARIEDAQPGSRADIEDAESLWSFMQNISRMVLKRHAEAAPAA